MTGIEATDRIFRVTKKAKVGDKPQARLIDMRVNEVSLVDRAANRRRFLLAKRDNMKTRLQADGRGGFVEIPVDKSEGEELSTSATDETKTDETKTASGESTDTAKGDEKKGDEAKGCGDKKKEDMGDEKKKPPFLKKSVSMLGAIAERVIDVAKSLDDGGEIPETFDEEIASMIGEVMKAARMTPSRKDRFSKALDELQKILGELAGAAEAAADAKKSDEDDRFDALKAEIANLKQTVEKQSDTIRELESQPAGSNALPVENSDESNAADDDVVWPLDMNEEHKVDKAAAQKRGVSFYD